MAMHYPETPKINMDIPEVGLLSSEIIFYELSKTSITVLILENVGFSLDVRY